MSARPTLPAARTELRWFALAVVSLAAAIFALHGRCISYGLFLDDYAHYRQLRESDWSLRGLTDACRLELVGPVLEMWWLPDTLLRFFRPVSFGVMKLTYELAGWNPAAMHVMSLVWHLAACTLLLRLLRVIGAERGLAWGMSVLFALHPGHVATVQWIACQTELMVTAFLLGATLCFARYRRWPGFFDQVAPAAAPRRGHAAWLVGSCVLFALALGCRENAVMFPFVMALIDGLGVLRRAGGTTAGSVRRLLPPYLVFGALLVVYLAVRSWALGGAALPPKPYVIPPGDPTFVGFIAGKMLYYVIGEFLLMPIVPFGGQLYLESEPWLFAGLAAGAIGLMLSVLPWRGQRRVALLAIAWLLLFMLPTLPAFASPHHLYLPGVGWAIVVMLIFRMIGGPTRKALEGRAPPAAGAPARASAARLSGGALALCRFRRGTMWLGLFGIGSLLGMLTHFFGLAMKTAGAVEDQVVEEVVRGPRKVEDGDTLYFANLPVIAHYVRLAVEEETGKRNLRAVALNWAPRVLSIEPVPSELRWIDERTLELIFGDDGAYTGPFGYLAREAGGGRSLAELAAAGKQPDFRVELLEQTPSGGVKRMRVTFRDPPTSGPRHLYYGSRTRWALELAPPPAAASQPGAPRE